MLTEDEIVDSLTPLNGTYFSISDVRVYARKVLSKGKYNCIRIGGILASYVLFYDDGAEAFISMVWTNPSFRNKGFANTLLAEIVRNTPKPIVLEVDKRNLVARRLYLRIGFEISSDAPVDEMRDRFVLRRRVAVMQPYIWPWIGYLQLTAACDVFVFYDDVNYIKRGRINRNSVLLNGSEHRFTVPLVDASQNRFILETRLHDFESWWGIFRRQLNVAYSKAPYFDEAVAVVESAVLTLPHSIADLAIASVVGIRAYLGMPFKHVRSSVFSPETRGMERGERLVSITKKASGSRYVNMPGGRRLYNKETFAERGVQLSFLDPIVREYRQFGAQFVGGLSSIDLMMFNSKEQIVEMVNSYKLSDI